MMEHRLNMTESKERLRPITIIAICLASLIAIDCVADEAEFPRAKWTSLVTQLDDAIGKSPNEVGLYSRRGDAYFFLGNYKAAVNDYQKMVAINPKLDVGHWRLGIAYYFAGQHKSGAKQFGKYHEFDQIDRENGIWKFLCEAETIGTPKARQQLIDYQKPDREPLPAVYKMFQGELSDAELLKSIRESKITEAEKQKRLFYAEMYVGFLKIANGKTRQAAPFFERASKNPWPARAGYGPNYMQHVSRLMSAKLTKQQPGESKQSTNED